MLRTPDELLYDSEAALRLVDTALNELQGGAAASLGSWRASLGTDSPGSGAPDIRARLREASVDIEALLDALRACRAILEASPQVLPVSAPSVDGAVDISNDAGAGDDPEA
jgi:hypothetical protein